MIVCTLGTCPHGHDGCRSLGQCGAAFVLKAAARPQGYKVLVNDNPTITALTAAGLITVEHGKWENIGVARAVAENP